VKKHDEASASAACFEFRNQYLPARTLNTACLGADWRAVASGLQRLAAMAEAETPVADATGKVVGDCRDYWPLNAQVSSCAMDARDACADPVIYMRTVSSSGPRSDTNVDGLTDFRVTYQCRRNVEGHG
jgi:hypothetical protein